MKAKTGDIYIIAFKEGSLSESEAERYENKLLDLGVRSVWIRLSNRMASALDQITIQKLEK